MSKKGAMFDSRHSPVTINKPDAGHANLVADWQRESMQKRMVIDGTQLEDYAARYNGFAKELDVENFFREVLLKKMTVTDAEKEAIVSYLKTVFHQGGLMYPVSSSFAADLLKEGDTHYAIVDNKTLKKTINIVTNGQGFKIQEFATCGTLFAAPHFAQVFGVIQDEVGLVIQPDKGRDYVVEMQGTIRVDFTKNANIKAPSITIESNTISYGNALIASKLDKRNFIQVIIDFLKNILGINKVEVIQESQDQQPPVSRRP